MIATNGVNIDGGFAEMEKNGPYISAIFNRQINNEHVEIKEVIRDNETHTLNNGLYILVTETKEEVAKIIGWFEKTNNSAPGYKPFSISTDFERILTAEQAALINNSTQGYLRVSGTNPTGFEVFFLLELLKENYNFISEGIIKRAAIMCGYTPNLERIACHDESYGDGQSSQGHHL